MEAEAWLRIRGRWPAADLSDLGNDPEHFPDGLPTCPVDGSAYRWDAAARRVAGHQH